MDDRRVTLPDLSAIDAARISAYSVGSDDRTLRLWVEPEDADSALVRVFTTETETTVFAVVVPPPTEDKIGRAGTGADVGPVSVPRRSKPPRETAAVGRKRYSSASMSKVCHSCGKGPAFGQSRSHSMVATKRRFNPNLQKVRVLIKGTPRREYTCTRCLKAGKVTKA